MVMLNNQMVSLKVSWEISMSLIQHQQADSPRRFSWWPTAWEKVQFSTVTFAVVMWTQKKGLGKPSDISMSLSFCHATKTHTNFRPVSLVGTASKSGLCESGELADEQIASSSMADEALGRRWFDGKSIGFSHKKIPATFPWNWN